MGFGSDPLQQRFTVRQDSAPNSQGPPWTWINPSGGANGNNRETYLWNDNAGQWELELSIGPDVPEREVDGSLWRDTSAGSFKAYDAGVSAWVEISKVFRGDTEPANPRAGDLWQDTSGNNVELNEYTGTTWELWFGRGSDSPTYPVEGSLWRDTSAGQLKQYDGSSWGSVGVTDHANLNNVTSGQHHAKTSQASELSDVSADSSEDAHHGQTPPEGLAPNFGG